MMRRDGDAVLLHALQDHAGVEGGAFDGGEQLVLRGVGEAPAERDAAEFGIHQDGAIAVVPGEAQQAGLAGAVVFEALGQFGDGTCRRGARWLRRYRRWPRGRLRCRCSAGWTEPGTTPQTPGIRLGFSPMAMMQVEVPTTLTTSPMRHAGADGVPMRVEGADGDGNAGAQAELRGPLGR